MNYQNTLPFAAELDARDPLAKFKDQFLVPQHNGNNVIYFCGNSLGLQPVCARQYLDQRLQNWSELAIDGFFAGEDPWLRFHKKLTHTLADIMGAKEAEVTVMNSLTVNLHLLLVSFYKPSKYRYKVLMESRAFPSDRYAVASQAAFHGFDPKEVIVEVFPRSGEHVLRTEDILEAIAGNAEELALVLFGGINYYTGQCFDMETITSAAHDAGALAGFDLAHAAGNVILKLHDWDVDFATWCSYKYMNSGPGGISGVFVNEKHFGDDTLHRFAGWWGHRQDRRFLMPPVFEADPGAAAWQVSTSPVMLLALHKAALDIFESAGGIEPLRKKSEALTGFLEFIIHSINEAAGTQLFNIITPKDPHARGCQLSIICSQNARATFDYLTANGVVGDWREPDVIRISPVPLYNSFTEVFRFGEILAAFAPKG